MEFYLKPGQAKIKIEYDNIKLIDKILRLWLVKTGNIYGVLDKNGKTVICEEYDAIGIDTTKFPPDKTHNGMMLFDNAIPVSKSGKWGLYNKDGNLILYLEYDGFGCMAGNLLTIPEVNGIIVSQNGFYGLVDAKGNNLIPCEYTKIYKITNMGKVEYYAEKDGKTSQLQLKI